jgi:hypothetical protein
MTTTEHITRRATTVTTLDVMIAMAWACRIAASSG